MGIEVCIGVCMGCTLISQEIPKEQKSKKHQNASKIPEKKVWLDDFDIGSHWLIDN